MKLNKINKKKFALIAIFTISLIFIASSFFGFSLATLYGGTNIDSVGGNVSYSATSVSGNQQILFSELTTDEVTVQITNNGQMSQGTVLPLTFNSASPLTEYQKKFTLTHQTGMQSDFSDIKFETTDGKHVPYFVESYVTDTSAEIWIRADFSTGDTIINCIYNNGFTVSESNPEEVFDFYDCFDRATMGSDYTQFRTQGTTTITDGQVTITTPIGGDYWEQWETVQAFGTDTAFMINMDTVADGDYIQVGYNALSTSTDYALLWYNTNPNYVTNNGATSNLLSRTDSLTTTHTWEIARNGVSSVIFSIDGIQKAESISNIPTIDMKVGFGVREQTMHVNWLAVRQYAPSEPTVSFGTEQSIINSSMTVSLTGDSDVHEYTLSEIRDITLIPSGAISQIDITSNSADFNYDISFSYSQSATETEQNVTNTTAFKEIQFTPNAPITSGYVNLNFTDLNFSNYTVTVDSAYLDTTEITETLIDNNTVSLNVTSLDATQHTANCTVSYSIPSEETPVVSSGGGGGSSYVPPVEETVNEDNSTEIVNSANLEAKDVTDLLGEDKNTYLIAIIFIAIIGLAIGLYKKK